jgi:GDP-4-dehydro-6-deoxy-D-mannose reductase
MSESPNRETSRRPPSRTALITGAAGFCGRHLAAELLAAGYGVAGLDRVEAPIAGVATYRSDLADGEQMEWVLRTVRPAVVFHLAALTDPGRPYEELHRANALGTLALLDAVRKESPDALVLVTSSSSVYGAVAFGELPIRERHEFRPASAYAASKVAQEMVAYQYAAEHSLRLVRARPFNLTGPGESAGFVTSAFARQIAAIEAGRQPPVVRTGSLDTVRDFLDVRDAVRAYRLLAEAGEPGRVYNVCSGHPTGTRQLLHLLLDLSRVAPIAVETDESRLRRADVPIQIGDNAALRRRTGWSPEIALERTVEDVLNYWRQRMENE